jgi:hypothetical protein
MVNMVDAGRSAMLGAGAPSALLLCPDAPRELTLHAVLEPNVLTQRRVIDFGVVGSTGCTHS